MPLTRQEIIDYASRYSAPDEHTDFPFDSDLFCLSVPFSKKQNVYQFTKGLEIASASWGDGVAGYKSAFRCKLFYKSTDAAFFP